MVTTSDLKPGDNVRLIHYGQTDVSYRRRLLALGVTCGVEARVVRRAPLGCPLQIDVRGTSLIIRVDEAALLQWEYV
jgi:ferrous iron transport protein A